ncbi:MAG: zinc ribbon domain-containing protein [Eubacteriales bacterium]|nr:zinc ribbon domain-containing protein [Eubacteriales bacterium]
MFCTKCGYNAGTAKFCPKCGNPLNPQPVEETPVQSEPVTESVQSAPQQEAQPQFGAVPPVNGDVPRYQEAAPMQPQPKKKKKKWPIVVAIVAVIAAAAAVLGFVVLPKIISPDKHAIAAIKKLGTGLEDTVSSTFDNMSLTSVSDKNEITGTLKIDTATIDGEKYSDYIKADTVTYDIQMDTSTEKMAGEIKLQNGSATALTLTFYSDGNNMYFKVPELFSESFVISMAQLEDEIDSGYYYGSLSDFSKYFSAIDTSNIGLYREPVNAAVKCVVKGINTFAEECEYKKGEKLTYNSDNGDIKVSEYSITITKDAVIKACETVIDELYASKDLSSYMTILSMAGVSQSTIKSSIESSLSDMQPVTISMYINKDDEIVRLAIDAADYNTSEKGFVAISFLGNDNPFEYIVIEADIDDMNMKYTVKTQDDKAALALEMTQNKEYIKAGAELSTSGTTVKIDNLYVNSNIDDSNIDMKLSGESTQKEFSKLKYSASDYSGAYNLANLTETQSTTLALELMKNSKALANVFSDQLYKQLFNGMSTSGNARLGF